MVSYGDKSEAIAVILPRNSLTFIHKKKRQNSYWISSKGVKRDRVLSHKPAVNSQEEWQDSPTVLAYFQL